MWDGVLPIGGGELLLLLLLLKCRVNDVLRQQLDASLTRETSEGLRMLEEG